MVAECVAACKCGCVLTEQLRGSQVQPASQELVYSAALPSRSLHASRARQHRDKHKKHHCSHLFAGQIHAAATRTSRSALRQLHTGAQRRIVAQPCRICTLSTAASFRSNRAPLHTWPQAYSLAPKPIPLPRRRCHCVAHAQIRLRAMPPRPKTRQKVHVLHVHCGTGGVQGVGRVLRRAT